MKVEETLEVNKFARRSRHLKNFSRRILLKTYLHGAIKFFSKLFEPLKKNRIVLKLAYIASIPGHMVNELAPVTAKGKILFKGFLLGFTTLLITTVASGGTFVAVSMGYETDYMQAYDLPGNILVADEDGYLVKINPQTDESNRVGMTDFAVHTVESGETLSVIADRYGVSMNTIIWENGLRNANSIRAGYKLFIPPIDGLNYKVEKGDTVESIAKEFKIDEEFIIAQNNVENNTITKGESLFLPNAKPIAPIIVADTRNPGAVSSSRPSNWTAPPNSTTTPSGNKIFIRPTKGAVTQGYRAGHYAIDIADRSKPPIWAAGSGTVEKVSVGTYGGGYGNHVVINHGNGLKTLYAHMDIGSVVVTQGQWINQGDVIGRMGATGRVYGVTGIHLHFEVIDNGVKQNPSNYF